MLQDLIRDVRYAVRSLTAAPAFALVAILTLGLGVGANTAIFSVINGLLLQPLPYPEPERLLFVDGVLARPDGEVDFQLSYPDVDDIRAQSKTLSAISPWTNGWGLALEGVEGAARLEANLVGRDYFKVLGGTPLLGRVFAADDHALGADGSLVAILSESAWQQHFGGDQAIVGKTARFQGRVFTIVGVMPSTFHDVAASQGARIEVWTPIERAPVLFGLQPLANRATRLMWAVGRLANEASVAQATAELGTLGRQVAAANPATNASFTYRAAALDNSFFVDARRPLWVLLGGSVFVLLIGCANVANLLLVRSSDRAREIAVRLAIGASHSRVIRQLLVESTVLALAGGLAGVLLAMWLTPLLVALSGVDLPAFASVGVDRLVLAAAFITAMACGLLFGLVPVWRATRISVRDTIAGGAGRGARSSRSARWLAGVEVTAAFVLAAGALLMLQSFSTLSNTDLQFRTDRLLAVRVELPQQRYGTPAARALAGGQVLERLRALPGVEQAIIWGPSMFARSTWVAFLSPADRVIRDDERLMVWRHSTNPGALADLGIRITAGRDLADTDTLGAPLVAVLSEAAAARLWPGQDAIGRQIRTGAGATALTTTIVGVAADARHRGRFRFSQGAAAFEPQLDLYLPFAQRPNNQVTLGVRTAGAASGYTHAVRSAIAGFDPTMPIYDVESLEDRMRTEEAPVAFAALLLNIYGGLAILLAGLGVYGVLAAAVSSRRRELGIRSALGANPSRLLTGVVVEGLTVSVVAIVIGAALSSALARAFGGMVFGVSPGSVAPLAAAAAILIGLSVAASLIPTRRAARVDPVQVLRID